jgi:hypothetical protein
VAVTQVGFYPVRFGIKPVNRFSVFSNNKIDAIITSSIFFIEDTYVAPKISSNPHINADSPVLGGGNFLLKSVVTTSNI